MTIAKFKVERFSLTSLKPFDAVVAAFKSAVGQPNMVEFFKETRATNSFRDLERVVQSGLGRTGLMLFVISFAVNLVARVIVNRTSPDAKGRKAKRQIQQLPPSDMASVIVEDAELGIFRGHPTEGSQRA